PPPARPLRAAGSLCSEFPSAALLAATCQPAPPAIPGSLPRAEFARRFPGAESAGPVFPSAAWPFALRPTATTAMPRSSLQARTARQDNSPAVCAVVCETRQALAATGPAPVCFAPVRLPIRPAVWLGRELRSHAATPSRLP